MTSTFPRPTPGWKFWLPLVAQAVLILAIPIQAVHTQVTGKTLILQTAPVDPYDLFRGYYVVLSYDISRPDRLSQLPGWEEFEVGAGLADQEPPSLFEKREFYVILEAPEAATGQPPAPWQPVRVSGDRPTNLPDNQVALRGTQGNWAIAYGLESYYIPEDQRIEINEQISQIQSTGGERSFVVEVKVNEQGQAVPISFWLDQRQYRF